MENGQFREKDTNKKSEVFGEKVRAKRIEKGLTQAALARLVWPEIKGDENQDSKYDVKRKCISGYEKGIYPKNTNDLLRLCNALGCDMGYLFGEYECSTKNLQGVVDFTGLPETCIKTLLNLTKQEFEFLENLLSPENRSHLYFIAGAYTEYQRTKIIDKAIESGDIPGDFGPDTLMNRNEQDYAKFTLSNRFLIFADESCK